MTNKEMGDCPVCASKEAHRHEVMKNDHIRLRAEPIPETDEEEEPAHGCLIPWDLGKL